MSVKVMSYVWDHAPEGASAGDMLVALTLADHADRDGQSAFPSLAEMSRATRLSERQVRRALRRLEDMGLIAVQKPSTRRMPTMYWFPLFRGDISAPPEANEGGHLRQSGGTFLTVRGDICDTHIYKELEPSVEPSVEPSESTRARKSTPKKKPKTPLPDDWEPCAAGVAFAEKRGWFGARIEREAEKFRAHHEKEATESASWPASWRTWVLNGVGFDERDRQRERASPNGVYRSDDVQYSDTRTPEDIARQEQERRAALAKSGESSHERWLRLHPEQAAGVPIPKSSASAANGQPAGASTSTATGGRAAQSSGR